MTRATTKKNMFQYQCTEGLPEKRILQEFVEINQRLFVLNESETDIEKLFNEKKMIMGCYAFIHDCLIGFKIGFEQEPHIFESWRGGVIEEFREQGIGTHLMELQHQWCKIKNFWKVVTVTNADNTAMISLNSRHGFKVIQHTTNRGNIQKVHFQKDLQ